jgi:hypothetical protein
MRQRYSADDADAGAGTPFLNNTNNSSLHNSTINGNGNYNRIESAPSSANTISSTNTDLEFFDERISEPVLVLGLDITSWSDRQQFAYCAGGVFFFSLAYGYLQELLSVRLCSRKLGLFLALVQFTGYTVLAYGMRQFVYHRQQQHNNFASFGGSSSTAGKPSPLRHVPPAMYLGLSLLRAIDLAMYVCPI